MHNLAKNVKVTKMLGYQAAGTTDTLTSGYVDMSGFESVTFIAILGAITGSGTATLKAQSATDSAFSDAADLESTGIAASSPSNNNQVLILEIVKPQERYVRPAIVRATANSVVEAVIAIQSNPDYKPTTHDTTTVKTPEVHVSPAEGTA